MPGQVQQMIFETEEYSRNKLAQKMAQMLGQQLCMEKKSMSFNVSNMS